MLRVLMDKADGVEQLMDKVSIGILRKKIKEILGIKNTVTEMKNAFDKLISRLDMAEGKNL